MQGQLKKLEGGAIDSSHVSGLHYLKEKYSNLQSQIKKAGEIIESKRSGMITNIQTEIGSMTGQVRTLEAGLMRDKLVDEACPPEESLKELDILNGKINKQK